eukprot:CAMPEP_0113876870 /NCGR_PEP_ID=MMETSP0780_2-20120614/5735_1 /TAXON_ID=652834 /ORGANISM="Palpitomonas bilix" /LENGTH=234 /DNA_ID=CAMNT_0000863013 /DNA_START=70 /DNA_END=774 /DNA_ORIENTATION=+ /assembly_acc=CAM_ASM_000599
MSFFEKCGEWESGYTSALPILSLQLPFLQLKTWRRVYVTNEKVRKQEGKSLMSGVSIPIFVAFLASDKDFNYASADEDGGMTSACSSFANTPVGGERRGKRVSSSSNYVQCSPSKGYESFINDLVKDIDDISSTPTSTDRDAVVTLQQSAKLPLPRKTRAPLKQRNSQRESSSKKGTTADVREQELKVTLRESSAESLKAGGGVGGSAKKGGAKRKQAKKNYAFGSSTPRQFTY